MKIALKTLSGFFVNLDVGSLIEKESKGMEDKSVSESSIIRPPFTIMCDFHDFGLN